MRAPLAQPCLSSRLPVPPRRSPCPCSIKPVLTLRSQCRRWEGALGAALLVQAAAGAAEAVALHRLRRQVRRHQQRGRLRGTQVPSYLQPSGFYGPLITNP